VVFSTASSQHKPSSAETQSNTSLRKVILSSMIGNALEWYDFALYGYFATLIAQLFFPAKDPFVSLLATYGTFAAGFIMRPLGGFLFGHIGDIFGRKKALLWSIYLMSVPTFLIGCLPTYDHVGWLAPILLTVVRLLQGLSMGGEFTGSIVFIVEHAEDGHRGRSGSWAPFSAVVGVLLGSGVAALITTGLNAENLIAWGWRIPFMLSLVGGFVGTYMRRMLQEPKPFKKAKKNGSHCHLPIKELLRNHKRVLTTVFLVDLMVAIGFYVIVTFVVGYLEKFIGFSQSSTLLISTYSMTAFALTIPLAGWCSDRFGRKPVLLTAALGFILLSLPLFYGFLTRIFIVALISHMMLGILIGCYFAVIPAVLVESFPTKIRYSGISIAHNLSMAIFGGSAPFVVTWLIKVSQNLLAPAFYLLLAAVGSLIGLLMMKEKYCTPLE
jgi:MHS family proline/betaine transporter-like MFS transporter